MQSINFNKDSKSKQCIRENTERKPYIKMSLYSTLVLNKCLVNEIFKIFGKLRFNGSCCLWWSLCVWGIKFIFNMFNILIVFMSYEFSKEVNSYDSLEGVVFCVHHFILQIEMTENVTKICVKGCGTQFWVTQSLRLQLHCYFSCLKWNPYFLYFAFH